MKRILILISVLFLAGCTAPDYAAKLAEYEKLGITKVQVTGKFSSTEYTVTKENGVRKAVFDHNNAWVPKVHVERETPITEGK